MPLEFIPNQPIIFEKPIGDYPCLNNDPKHYAQLVQDGDITCVQWILDACDEPMCEPDMVMDPVGSDELGSWSNTSGWTTTGSDNLSFVGANAIATVPSQLSLSLTTGAVYRIKFDVDYLTANAEFKIQLLGTVNSSDTPTITTSGSYEYYLIALSAGADLYLRWTDTLTAKIPADTLGVSNIELVQVTDCWQDGQFNDLESWKYLFNGANGRFCSLITDGGDLTNTTAFTTTGNYHGVTMVIDSCTQGGLEVRLGSVLLGTTSGNGSFEFYGTPTAGTDLVFTKVDEFNGCISQVNVLDYGDITTSAVTVRSENNFYKSDALTPTAFNDRLVQCIDWENLDWNMNGVPGDCIPLQVTINDACDNDVVYYSINRALYKSGGATWDCTKLVESWNDGYAFGFYFGDIASPDFKLTQRLRVLAFNPVYRNAGEEYLYSSGNSGRSFAQSQKARTAWFDYMDEYAHDCTRTQLLGQKLFIEGYAFYYPTEDYEPEWNENGKYNLAQSRVTVFHEEAIFGSACGVMANTVCPPQVVPTPVPAESTTIEFNASYIAPSFDFTNVDYRAFSIEPSGATLGIGAGANLDLTSPGDMSLLESAAIASLSNELGVTATGNITLLGSTITYAISGPFVAPFPSRAILIALTDSNGISLPIVTIQS